MTGQTIPAKRRAFLREASGRLSNAIKRARGAMDTPWRRLLGRLETLFIDHAVFRLVYLNFGRVSDRLWRSGQPTPRQVARLARRGIRTIVNLRGKRDCASYLMEVEACRRHGITLVDFQVHSRQPPSRDTIHAARELFARIEYPALIHCKVGSDRSGIMGALYLLVADNQPVEAAIRQLSLRYGHIRHSKAGVLDHFLEEFRDHGTADFFAWVDGHYDPAATKASHRSRRWADLLYERILRRE